MTLFEYSMRGLENKLQAGLSLYYNHQMMMEQFKHSAEMEQMKNEIINEVLSRISVSADITKAVQEIESLNQQIKNIGK